MGIDTVTGSIAGTKPFSDLLSSIQIKTFSGDALVIHAPYDREATFSDAREMRKAGPNVSFVEAPGLGHRRIITDQGVFDAIRAFALEKSQSAAA
jgi:pimeloyl-ACP methyl ester carboxylesterase